MLEPVNITSVVHKSVIIEMENQFRWPRARVVVERRPEMEKKHSRDKKVVPRNILVIEKNVHKQIQASLLFHFPYLYAHSNYLLFSRRSWILRLVDGNRAVIYNISPPMPWPENFRTTQKPIKLLFLSSRWNLMSILWKFVDDGSSPKSEVDRNQARWTRDTVWLWLRERTNV